MTREEAIFILKRDNPNNIAIRSGFESLYDKRKEAFSMAIKALEQEPILDKIFCIIHPLSIMSTPELEHKAIMQIAEMLEPLCLPKSEEEE